MTKDCHEEERNPLMALRVRKGRISTFTKDAHLSVIGRGGCNLSAKGIDKGGTQKKRRYVPLIARGGEENSRRLSSSSVSDVVRKENAGNLSPKKVKRKRPLRAYDKKRSSSRVCSFEREKKGGRLSFFLYQSKKDYEREWGKFASERTLP